MDGLGSSGVPRMGRPKTEEERRKTHLLRFGTEELPPRGTGLHLTSNDYYTLTVKIPKKQLDELEGSEIIILNLSEGKIISGGIVVDEEKALSTPCHGYDLGEGKKMLWSKGVIGTLSLPEQEKYCRVGMRLKPVSEAPRLARRIKILREAGIEFD